MRCLLAYLCLSPLATLVAQTPEQLQVAIDLGQRSPPADSAPAPGGGPAVNEELFYKFDDSGGGKSINFAPVVSPREGVNVSTAVAVRVPGRFGTALGAGTITPTATLNRVETGWMPGQLSDISLTWAAFLRVGNNNPAPSLSYVFGIPVALQFRVFGGATALTTSSWRPSAPTLRTQANVFGLASANWVHVALVIDATNLTATYYIDGVAEAPITIPGGFNANVTAFNVGQQITTLSASVYELDDFRLLTRAATAGEIAAWALASTPIDAGYGAGCGASLGSQGGAPQIGNGSYALSVSGTAGAVGALGLGSARHDLGGVPLPFDLGLLFPPLAGCGWETSADVFLPVALGGGTGTVPLAIPNVLALRSRSLYAQALVFAGTVPQSSNPFAISIEP